MAIQIILPFLLLQFLNFHELHAQISPNISLGTSITAGSSDSWRSLSDDFAFGFYSLPNNLYLVGIWFNKIPERTLVWSANRDSPAAAGSTVRLTFDGQLTLTHLNGSVELIYRGRRAALGFMGNDGNFVLRDDGSGVVWESFSSPTDTILPGQNLSGNQKLYSNANGTVDYSTGNFMLEMQYDGNLVLSAYHFSDPGYWYTRTLTTNVSLVFNNYTASMYLVNSTDLARVKDVDLEGCKKALTDDCDSLAASLVDSRCIKKRMPLLNARKSFSTKGRQALVKVPMKSSPEHKKKNDFDVRVFLRISVIVTATLAFCFGVSSIYYHPAPRSFIRRRRYSNANSIGINFQEFKYMELQKATNGFSKALGRGSSAKVYSGILSIKDMHIDIAVKVLEKSIEKDPSRVEEESEEDDLVLSDWVISCMAAGKLETVVGHDPEVLSDFERFERMALVGLWCIHPDAMFRPSMKKVTQMLEGTLEIGIPPSLSDQMSVSNYTY
ncbi:hypothetical protein OIU77_004225 [Salix suchowensis]|uniref:Bulb-type lectin domain-containing protein n=1 Tax=Salix suchowensis TaxID=1278906 RepID=A0ABQ9AVR1_9ROSI|nr:hypothetical protein OIU77_004225 [Salix suchowensis]